MIERVRPASPRSIFEPLPVLITESAEEFKQFYDLLHAELKPRRLLERHYVADIADKAWEIRRLRRVKANLINSAWRRGLIQLLKDLNNPASYSFADQWFGDERGKKEILEMLKRFKLDEYAIEAAAVRFVADDLEKVDRLVASAELRLSRDLRVLAELRGTFGQQLHAKVERVIDGKVLALEDASKKGPSKAA